MAATVREVAHYACDRDGCHQRANQTLGTGQSDGWPDGYDWVRENLPVGWAVVDANPVGQVGRKRWVVCSAGCLGELLDVTTSDNITRCLR